MIGLKQRVYDENNGIEFLEAVQAVKEGHIVDELTESKERRLYEHRHIRTYRNDICR